MATGPLEAAFPATPAAQGRLGCEGWACSSHAPRTRAQRAPGLCGPGTETPLRRRTGRQANPTLQGWLCPGKGRRLLATTSGKGAGRRSAAHLGASTQTEAGWTLGVWAWELLPVGEPGLGVPSARPGPTGAGAGPAVACRRGQHPCAGSCCAFRGPEAGWPHGGVWKVGEGVAGGRGFVQGLEKLPSEGVPWPGSRLGWQHLHAGSQGREQMGLAQLRGPPRPEAPMEMPLWPPQVPPNVSPLL